MKDRKLEKIESWQADPSFVNWAMSSNEDDVAKWNTYFKNHPEDLEIAQTAQFAILNIEPIQLSVDKSNSEKALASLQNRIKTDAEAKSPKSTPVRRLQIWQIAASFLLVATCIWGYNTWSAQDNNIVMSTSTNQHELMLADGTKVILNENSSLSYDEDNVRQVVLNGEAYFEVAKSKGTNQYFQVRTEDLLVTVLGTEFNVNNVDGHTSVYLDEGKIRLNLEGATTSEIEMSPGQIVSYSKDKQTILENGEAISLAHTAWKEDIITFNDKPLSEVIESMALIYKVSIEKSPEIKMNEKFTGGIPVDDLDIALQILKDIYNLKIKKTESTIILSK